MQNMTTNQRSEFPQAIRYPLANSISADIALVPYAKVGDEWTLSDDVVLSLAARALDEHVLESVFVDGSVRTPTQFLALMQRSDNIPIFAFSGNSCVGAAWLNGCVGNVAFGHFMLVRGGRGDIAHRAGKLVLDYWRAFVVGNRPLFDVILGIIPSANNRAVEFVQRIGFVKLGEIPKMLRGQTAALFYCIFAG